MDITNISSSFDTSSLATSSKKTFEMEHSALEPKTTTELNKQNQEQIKENLNNIANELNDQMSTLNTNLEFGFNDKINSMYIDVHEKSTGRLIRKFPTEEAMRLAEHLKEFVGILFDKKG